MHLFHFPSSSSRPSSSPRPHPNKSPQSEWMGLCIWPAAGRLHISSRLLICVTNLIMSEFSVEQQWKWVVQQLLLLLLLILWHWPILLYTLESFAYSRALVIVIARCPISIVRLYSHSIRNSEARFSHLMNSTLLVEIWPRLVCAPWTLERTRAGHRSCRRHRLLIRRDPDDGERQSTLYALTYSELHPNVPKRFICKADRIDLILHTKLIKNFSGIGCIVLSFDELFRQLRTGGRRWEYGRFHLTVYTVKLLLRNILGIIKTPRVKSVFCAGADKGSECWNRWWWDSKRERLTYTKSVK